MSNGVWEDLSSNIRIYQTNFAVSVTTNLCKFNPNSGFVKIQIQLILPGAKTFRNILSLINGFPRPASATYAVSGTCNGTPLYINHPFLVDWSVDTIGQYNQSGTFNTATQDTYILNFLYLKGN